MKRSISFAFILFSAWLLFNISPVQTSAEADITIDAEAGFQNKVKYNRGLPLQITASNNGTAFSGDLVIDYSESYNIGAGLSVPLELAAGETKTFNLSLPGMMDNSYTGGITNQTIYVYEGGWEKGDAIDFQGSKTLRPNYFVPETPFIATLTENADRLRGLGGILPVSGASAQVFHFNMEGENSLPSDPLAWDTLDYLVIDEFPYSDLPVETQQAAMAWLEQGGKVLVGADSNLAAATGNLSDLLPMQLNSSEEMAVLELENPISVYQADVGEDAQVVLEEQGRVLAVKRTVGAGTIIQTAFSLGDEPVISQEGYEELLVNLFEADQISSAYQQDQSIKERISYEIGMVNELFESFAVSKTAMFLIILLYIIIVVPVLYIFLIKKDKREYAWLAIPLIAVLASIGIFAAGAKDRIANPQIQQTGFFEVDGDGGLNGYYMNTLLSNRSGDYRFTAPANTTMTATTGDQFSASNAHQNAILEKGAAGSTLTVRDMRYWSMASVIGESYISGSGQFDIQLAMENGNLTGTVRNSFPFSVKDAAIWTGTRLITLGDFNPDEEKQIAEAVQSDLLQPISPIAQYQVPQTIGSGGEEELIEARKQSALAMSYEHLGRDATTPYLIAYADAAIAPVALEKQEANVSAVHLLAQSFEPSMNFDGEVAISSDNLRIDVQPQSAMGHVEKYPDNPHFYGLEPGEYRVLYELPSALTEKETEWSRFETQSASTDVEFSILRTDTGEYEPLAAGSNDLSGNSGNYISDGGNIEIRITKNEMTGYSEITIPKIELEGVVDQ
ncbi:hypothetical protein [Planococcus halotolerans]|uniref:Uncharacterized protein n=1 Tax=Planococcus halotolerans TaxID=2233542 RepID=A0A365L221_9BACL|nr:hypothetical protein [Planococcus halotolerans]RAZ79432.1 hypothetical protein DP120_07420 [Planococcus halotolerans]